MSSEIFNHFDTFLSHSSEGVLLQVKAVPCASRTRIAGVLGDRLKVQVAAAPEGGKANKAICKLLAKTFSLPPREVCVIRGTTNPHKTVQLSGLDLNKVIAVLQMILQ
ncbi:MAG TPA: DUF167 domain-containing protein [Phycisphaerales bacterium]|nr:DUF167 domain-containing protein [Phycisphaerales bacterium]HCD34158.1 DUF167 domain-containing protein [Phycisphaerales bacterium]|tara:strand:+ start:2303 stop:2626 length:324 start_codon:yes stop_codon:yes gene_type:complete